MGAFNYNIIISNIFFNFDHIPAKMHLKVNNSEDNLFFLKMPHSFVNIIASNHSTKWQCCTIKSNEVLAFCV